MLSLCFEALFELIFVLTQPYRVKQILRQLPELVRLILEAPICGIHLLTHEGLKLGHLAIESSYRLLCVGDFASD